MLLTRGDTSQLPFDTHHEPAGETPVHVPFRDRCLAPYAVFAVLAALLARTPSLGSQPATPISGENRLSEEVRRLLEADDLAIRAWMDMNETRFSQGLEKAEQAAAIDPDSPRVRRAVARGFLLTERYGRATAAFRAALELDEADSASWCGLVFAHCLSSEWVQARSAAIERARSTPNDILLADATLLSKSVPDMVQLCERISAANPSEPLAHLVLASAKFVANDRPGAFSAASRAIALDPQFALAYEMRAIVGSNTLSNEKLLDHTKAIELGADFATPYANRAIMYQRVDPRNGLEDAQAAVRLCPPSRVSPATYIAIAQVHYVQGDIGGAQAAITAASLAGDFAGYIYFGDDEGAFKRWIATQKPSGPNDAVYWYLRGVAADSDGRVTEARDCFQEAVRISPEWFSPQFCLAHVYRHLREEAAATEWFVRAARVEPRFGPACSMALLMLQKAGEADRAEQAAEILARHHPHWPVGLRMLAERDLAGGRYEQAIRRTTESLYTIWNEDALYVRSQARRELGDMQGEKNDLDLSILTGKSPRALLARGRAFLKLKQVGPAVEDLLQAKRLSPAGSLVAVEAWGLVREYVVTCDDCAGSGYHTLQRYTTCSMCGGSGSVGFGTEGQGTAALRPKNVCRRCNGTQTAWETVNEPCQTCGGNQVRIK